MKTNAKIYWVLCLWGTLLCNNIYAQTYSQINGQMTVFSGSGASELSQRLYIGPNANINVIGEWRIASEEIFIATGATISGTGTIILDQPSMYNNGGTPLAWTRQTIDGGGVPIGCKVVIRNPASVQLANLTPPTIFGYPIDNTAELGIDNSLIFANTSITGTAIANNNLVLNANNVVFSPTASVENYNPKHFIITNGTGSVIKMGLGSDGFIFPIGITISDYCPAQLSNHGIPDRYSVRVLAGNYPGYDPERSVDRTWAITEEVQGGSNVTLTLQHNHTSGYGGQGSEGTWYNDSTAFIASSAANSVAWDSYPTAVGMMPGTLTVGQSVNNASMLMRTGIRDFTIRTRYTKYSVIEAVPPAKLHAIKTVNPDSIYIGDEFSYHFAITNNTTANRPGPITLIDTLPAGAQYINAWGPGWTMFEQNGIVTATYADTLDMGETAVFDITVKSLSDNLKNIGYISDISGTTPTAPCDTCQVGQPTYPGIKWSEMIIPNAISPNGDGVNDKFRIPELSRLYPFATLSIYNRWSDGVWYSNGPYMNDFDGMNYSGIVLPDGTYFYVMDYNDGSDRQAKGFINITR